MASDRFQFISRVRQGIGALGGDVSHFVSPRSQRACSTVHALSRNPAAAADNGTSNDF